MSAFQRLIWQTVSEKNKDLGITIKFLQWVMSVLKLMKRINEDAEEGEEAVCVTVAVDPRPPTTLSTFERDEIL